MYSSILATQKRNRNFGGRGFQQVPVRAWTLKQIALAVFNGFFTRGGNLRAVFEPRTRSRRTLINDN